jgi:hypothetical protein
MVQSKNEPSLSSNDKPRIKEPVNITAPRNGNSTIYPPSQLLRESKPSVSQEVEANFGNGWDDWNDDGWDEKLLEEPGISADTKAAKPSTDNKADMWEDW